MSRPSTRIAPDVGHARSRRSRAAASSCRSRSCRAARSSRRARRRGSRGRARACRRRTRTGLRSTGRASGFAGHRPHSDGAVRRESVNPNCDRRMLRRVMRLRVDVTADGRDTRGTRGVRDPAPSTADGEAHARPCPPAVAGVAVLGVGLASAQDFPDAPGDADRAVARRRLDRHRHARARDGDREIPRAADRRREPSRRRGHARRDRDGHREARRLHDHARSRSRCSATRTWAGRLRPADRPHLHHRHLRLHVRRGRARGLAVEDLGRPRRVREGQSRQGLVRHARRQHVAARDDGGHRATATASSGRRCRSAATPTT